MNNTFYIVDDDKSVYKVLSNIIADHELGEVLGWAEDGLCAEEQIAALRPAIVLIDLLLPGVDGITLVEKLRAACPETSFVMVSQVTSKEMISKAYLAGIDFFISKPVNVVEVVSVLRKVQDKQRLQGIIHSMQQMIGGVQTAPQPVAATATGQTDSEARRKVSNALTRLGIQGEAGSRDLMEMSLLFMKVQGGHPAEKQKMNPLYDQISQQYLDEYDTFIPAATIEQRIRRAILKALNNLANMGLEDYGNEVFTTFGSAFFDFAEVRRQMNYLRGSSAAQGKINVRKFFEGMVVYLQETA